MSKNEQIKLFPKTDFKQLRFYSCGISYCDYSYKIDRRNSKCYSFEYINKGVGCIHTPKGKFYPKEGDMYLLHAGDDHYYYSSADDPWTKTWINISGELVDCLVKTYRLNGVYLIEGIDVGDDFDEIIKIAYSKLTNETIINNLSIILHRILIKAYNKLYVHKASIGAEAQAMKDFIDRNTEKNITIDDLCRYINCSRSQCIRIFRSAYGITPYEYLLVRKANAAKEYLRCSAMSIKQISYMLGFANEHYFSRFFKARTGKTPGQYRSGD